MTNLLRYILAFTAIIVLINGCTNPEQNTPIANLAPKTFLWLYPDSSIAEGHSRQRIHWWGEDPDGVVKGFLIASGRLYANPAQIIYSDTIVWRMRLTNDSLMAFPLKTKRDTFQVAVRAVDNTFTYNLPDGALIRFVSGGTPYWDKNGNGQFDASDLKLPDLNGATDKKGAVLGVPVLNQPPSVSFAQDPNNPSVTMQQPETTFTAATFAWAGTDPDGDETIASYEITLNDTTDNARIFTVGGNIKLVTLLVPRDRSNPFIGDTGHEVAADVWSGTFATNRLNIGQISHLKLDMVNTFYIRARDIAGDKSSFIKLPSDSTRHWFVRNPKSNFLIVNDYNLPDKAAAQSFYTAMLAVPGVPSPEILNIKLLTANGSLVPPFLDPALIYTLHLFDLVCWYSDVFPSLNVAQVPLYEYTRDPSHHGKVIFSTQFKTASDPRGALTDFAPIDSVSTVDLNSGRLLPTNGDSQIPGGYVLSPDPGIMPTADSLRFNQPPNIHGIYMRPVYKRPDADYLYSIQLDARSPISYAKLATTNDLNSIVVLAPGNVLACGTNGTVFSSNDAGATWNLKQSGVTSQLNSFAFRDASRGWCVGDEGVILQTTDGGSDWQEHTVFTYENLAHVQFVTDATGFICGTTGQVLRTDNAGARWDFMVSNTSVNLHSVSFIDANHGIAVGDAGTIIRTTDGDSLHPILPKATAKALYDVAYLSHDTIYAVGASGVVVASTNSGANWHSSAVLTDKFSRSTEDLHSIYFSGNHTGWITGANGVIYQSVDGGKTWVQQKSGIEQSDNLHIISGQTITSIATADNTEYYLAASGGVMMKTINNGLNWGIIPGGQLKIAVIDGTGSDGKRSFVFFGLPLHLLNGNQITMKQFFQTILHTEFGL